jgi:hypothetical protein
MALVEEYCGAVIFAAARGELSLKTGLFLCALLPLLLVGCVKTREIPVEQTVVVHQQVVVTPEPGFL